jgi:hypothetical protein
VDKLSRMGEVYPSCQAFIREDKGLIRESIPRGLDNVQILVSCVVALWAFIL